MDDFTPFLQIVHISDLHFCDPDGTTAIAARGWIRRLRKISPRLARLVEDGVAAHDPTAAVVFSEFLNSVAVKDPVWNKCKTWLIDTGDLTTTGDIDALTMGHRYLNDLATICPELVSIYGNHDAWPGVFPFFAPNSSFALQETLLKNKRFSVATPGMALRVPVPDTAREVQLYFVDSIMHDRIANTFARGEVPKKQLGLLSGLVDKNFTTGRHDFRILAVHHPIHYPPPRPAFQMSMKNDSTVAGMLGRPSSAGAYPLAHLVLSGHTHALYPKHGMLPVQTSLCHHADLGKDQCQLVVGSLLQLDINNKRAPWPHQCQILRFYFSPLNDSVLLMERLLAARQAGGTYSSGGLGPFKFVGLPDKVAEELTFTV